MRRAASLTFVTLLALMFAAAFWLRAGSLECLPDLESDEAWYGTQAYHIAQGEPAYVQTPTGNPLNPFHTGIEILLLKVFKPDYWILRAPAVICGVLAVILAYILGSRIFDRTTALIACAMLAVLPVAILYSRKGYDCSPTPLMNILVLYYAYRTSWRGVLAALTGSMLCHPTNIFILPVVLAIYLVQSLRAASGDSRRQRRLITAALVTLGLVFLVGLAFLQRPQPREVYTRNLQAGHLSSADGWLFLKRFADLIIGTGCFGQLPDIGQQWAFWTIGAFVVIAGTIQLARKRNWERLALVAGLFTSALSLFLVTGATALRPDANRYGLFLVVPSVFSFAVLLQSLLAEPVSPRLRVVRGLQYASLLVLGWSLLFCYKRNCIDAYRGGSREESLLTFRTDAKDPKKRAMRMIMKELDQRGPSRDGSPTIIIGSDWWTSMALSYLAVERKGLIFSRLPEYTPPAGPDILSQMERGAFAVCFPGDDLEKAVYEQFPAERLARWEAIRYGNTRTTALDWSAKSVVVLSVKRAPEPLARHAARATRKGSSLH